MKKILLTGLLIFVAVFVFAAGTKDESSGQVLKTKPLKVAISVQTGHSMPFIVADKVGILAKYGLTAHYLVVTSGAAAIEALPSGAWDFMTAAIPGWMGGSLRYNLKIISDALDEEVNVSFLARPDSEIVKKGKGHIPGYPDVYGTPETWRGKRILMPTGTSLHFVLSGLLNALGFKEGDVKITNMEVPQAFTAFKAGNGDICGAWTAFYDRHTAEGHIPVAHQNTVFIKNPTIFTASEKVIKTDPALVRTALKVYYDAWEYMTKNKEECAQIISDWHIDNGFNMDSKMGMALINKCKAKSFNEMNEIMSSGAMQKMANDCFNFFASIGKYKQSDWDVLKNNFYPDALRDIAKGK